MHCDIFFFHVISSSRCASFLISSYRRGKRQKAKDVKSNLSPTRYCQSSNRLNTRTPQGKKREQLTAYSCGFKIAAGPIRVRRRALIHTQNLKVSESYKFGGDNNVSQSYCLVSQLSSFHLRLSLSFSLSLSLGCAQGLQLRRQSGGSSSSSSRCPVPQLHFFHRFVETL
jgi:hypothetical protein